MCSYHNQLCAVIAILCVIYTVFLKDLLLEPVIILYQRSMDDLNQDYHAGINDTSG